MLPKGNQPTTFVVGDPFHGYPEIPPTELYTARETADIEWGDCGPHYNEWPMQPCPARDDAVFLHDPYQPQQLFPLVAGGFHPPYGHDISSSLWRGDVRSLRCATYPGSSTHLTLNISIPLSQVSHPHSPWRFVAIQSARRAGIDLMSPRTDF